MTIAHESTHEARIPIADGREVRQSVRPLIGADLPALVRASLILVVATGIGLLGPIVLGRIIDLTTNGRSDLLLPHAVAFFAVVLVGAGLTGVGQVKLSQVGEIILERLRNGLLGQALSVPLTRLERAGVGDLVSRMTSDINSLTRVIRNALPECALAALEISLLFIGLVVISPWFALALTVGMVPVVLGGRWYLRHAPPRYDEERRRVGTLMGRIQEFATGWRTVRAYGYREEANASVQAGADGIYDALMATTRARNVLRPAVIAGQTLALIGTLMIGTVLVRAGSLTLGLVTAAALYQLRLINPVSTLLELMDDLQSASASYRRVLGVRSVARAPRPAEAQPKDAGLDIRSLNFRFHDQGPLVLSDIDLSIAAGEHLAVVGPSGAGKTTLGKLIAGMEVPTAGSLHLGGIALDALGDSLPRQVVMLTQETHVFSGTLAEDLRLARPGADDPALWRVLEQVGAAAWVRTLPAGLDEPVGSGHRRLTPAQEQQIALARLLLLDPKVVVLDEAMAAMGPSVASRMETRLDAALRGRTVIAITHRLEAAARADRIAVIVDGRLRELGSHAELIGSGGLYAQLWARHEGAPG